MRRWIIILLGGLLLGAGLAALVFFGAQSKQTGPEIGKNAPGGNPVELSSGQPVQLDAFKGKVVILNFWATWCVPCQNEMPLLEKFQKEYADRLVVLAVNSQEARGDVANFVEQNHLTFHVAIDANGEMLRNWAVQGYPTTYFIDANGVIRAIHIGELREDYLVSYLKPLGALP